MLVVAAIFSFIASFIVCFILLVTGALSDYVHMSAVLVTGPTAMQNLAFLP